MYCFLKVPCVLTIFTSSVRSFTSSGVKSIVISVVSFTGGVDSFYTSSVMNFTSRLETFRLALGTV